MLMTSLRCWWRILVTNIQKTLPKSKFCYVGDDLWILVTECWLDVSEKNGQNRNQNLIVVTNTFRLQHPSPTSMFPCSRPKFWKTHPITRWMSFPEVELSHIWKTEKYRKMDEFSRMKLRLGPNCWVEWSSCKKLWIHFPYNLESDQMWKVL